MPIRADLPAYTFQLALEGTLYNFEFRYNERMERWLMDINDENQSPLLKGIPVQTDFNLIERFKDDRLPPGEFFAIDESGEGKQPSREDFGNDVKLFYIESDEG
jgi:hypothetical protein